MCIAPVTISRVLGKYGIKVTIGNDKTIAKAIEETGATHIDTTVTEACVDEKNKVVTTSAYMLANSIKEVSKGAQAMVDAMIKLSQ